MTLKIKIQYEDSIKVEYVGSTHSVTKEFLNELVKRTFHVEKFKLLRQSKRARGFVPLQSEQDYAKLMLSIQSRPHMKLKVVVVDDFVAAEPALPAQPASVDAYHTIMEKIVALEKQIKGDENDTTMHSDVFCDGCYPTSDLDAVCIRGVRYKCLYCDNYDLCSRCEANGVATGSHKSFHNMMKIKTPDSKLYEYLKPKKEFSVVASNRDLVIDIPEENEYVYDFFSKITSEQELKDIVDVYKASKKATGDISENFGKLSIVEASKSAVEVRHVAEDNLEDDPADSDEDDCDEPISVTVTHGHSSVKFDVENPRKEPLPACMTLVFNYEQAPGEVRKFEIPMGRHEINSRKTLTMNTFGKLAGFSNDKRFSIGLQKDSKVLYYGYSLDEESRVELEAGSDNLTQGFQPQVEQSMYASFSSGVPVESTGDLPRAPSTIDGSVLSDSEEYEFLTDQDTY